MTLADRLSKPIFHVTYRTMRWRDGARDAPIRRKVTPVDDERRRAFDELLQRGLDDPRVPIDYDLPWPKSEFLHYVCDWRGFVAHGSPLTNLDVLLPIRTSTDVSEFGSREQIFASPDAMWAMWFAILDKTRMWLTSNGSTRVGRGSGRVKYYYFEVLPTVEDQRPFADGTIYLARAEDFPHRKPSRALRVLGAEIEEWGGTEPVVPLARLDVSPSDFPYLDRVQFTVALRRKHQRKIARVAAVSTRAPVCA